jgi:hypothetical protein
VRSAMVGLSEHHNELSGSIKKNKEMSSPAAKLTTFPRMWTKKAIKTHQPRDMANSDNKLFQKSTHTLSVISCSFNQLANIYRILRGASIQRHINLTYAHVIDYYVTPQQI